MQKNGIKIGSWNGIQLKENNMRLLKVYHSAWVFKFIYDTGYLYTPTQEIICAGSNNLTCYTEVFK